jgi:hypothetical protein
MTIEYCARCTYSHFKDNPFTLYCRAYSVKNGEGNSELEIPCAHLRHVDMGLKGFCGESGKHFQNRDDLVTENHDSNIADVTNK